LEFRRIDADEHIGPRREKRRADAREQAQQARQIAQDLEQSHDGQRLGGLPDLAAGGLHFGTGDAEEFGIRRAPPQGRISPAPSVSPDASPATRPTRSGAGHRASERCCASCA
jgi:hypothetical protein